MLRFRDLGALVTQAPYARSSCSSRELESYRDVIDHAFVHGAILPAPCGTIFRGADQVRLWLEQNYIALSEGIHFVAGRCEARVHVFRRSEEDVPVGESSADAEMAAAECFRMLRRDAVATVPVSPRDTPAVLSCAFLLQQDRWGEFADQVREQARRCRELAFEHTGPWPPYDFVRMDFGA